MPGGTIAYEVHEPVGTGAGSDATSRPLVVCSPAMGDVRDVYVPLAQSLNEAGFRVVTADLRGHGDSSATFTAYGDEVTAADLIALIEVLDAGPAILMGASMYGAAAVIAAFMLVAWLTNMSFIGWLIVGIMGSFTAALLLLSILTRRALYSQVEDTAGAVKVALSQIQRGWVIPEQPVAFTREQDLVWRIVGRAGVVLISEGPASRVRPLLQAETKRVTKVMRNVPVHQIQVGHDDGQIALKDLQRELRKLKNVLTPEEVPQVSARINALRSGEPPIPKGIDPLRAKPSRRALRGN